MQNQSTATIFVYKSDRKNSKCEMFNIHHLISNEIITDERILSQIINSVEKVLECQKALNTNKLILHSYVLVNHPTCYLNANNELFIDHDYMISYVLEKEEFSSLEKLINHIYKVMTLIYPRTKLSTHDIFNNPSINYIIKNYYNL